MTNVSGYIINIPLMTTAKKNMNASRSLRVNILAPMRSMILIHFMSMIELSAEFTGISTVDIQSSVTIPKPITATLARRFDATLILANPRIANTDTQTKNNIPISTDPPDQNANNPNTNDTIQNQRREIIAIRFWNMKKSESIKRVIIQNGSKKRVDPVIDDRISTIYAAMNIAIEICVADKR